MTLVLGLDTGGTYTDAVLLEDEERVIAKAKALTTRHDLAIGIGEAARRVLAESGAEAGDVALVSLSTTLATNALVEGYGGRVGLIYIGFRAEDLETHGLTAALKGDPVLVTAGGHDHAGAEAATLDLQGVADFLDGAGRGMSAYAVASQFATRNAAHETAVARVIGEKTGRPVSMSHVLSARLNGPKRAMTALLNARLIGMIDRLIRRAEYVLVDLGISSPLMVVRGDGALISAAQARERPIETILSGPAASIVGARWLTGAQSALVSDIGGTTTDVAVLRNGRPALDLMGARVGPYRTMVEAVAMRTTGLGGDSEVHVVTEGLERGVVLGPRRVLPVSLLAAETPESVHAALDRQMQATVPGEFDGRFVRAVPDQSAEGLGVRELGLLERIGDGVQALDAVLRARVERGALMRLLERGLVQLSGVTPSDACHVLGDFAVWDGAAAQKALALFARKRTGSGQRLSDSAMSLADMIAEQLRHQTITALLEAAFDGEDPSFDTDAGTLASHEIVRRGLAGHAGLVKIEAGLNVPVIGLGASAHTYYPGVGKALRTRMILPEHADVANAIGAVVGRITMRREGTVTSQGEGKFRAHFSSGPRDYAERDAALEALENDLRERARTQAVLAGAQDIQIRVTRDIRSAGVEAREVFVEATIRVEAAGRPRVATG